MNRNEGTTAALAALGSLLLGACSDEPDRYICTKSETRTVIVMLPFPNGNGGVRLQPMPQAQVHCLEHAENPEWEKWSQGTPISTTKDSGHE